MVTFRRESARSKMLDAKALETASESESPDLKDTCMDELDAARK